jgi:ankyrin repeat protein
MQRSVEEVLQSVSDVLFPQEMGEAPVAIDSRSSEGDTPLHVMAWRKDVDGARILLAAGADVDAIGDMDETPLHVAIAQDDIEMVELLLASGATVTFRSEFGNTALEEADAKGGVMQQLVRRYAST